MFHSFLIHPSTGGHLGYRAYIKYILRKKYNNDFQVIWENKYLISCILPQIPYDILNFRIVGAGCKHFLTQLPNHHLLSIYLYTYTEIHTFKIQLDKKQDIEHKREGSNCELGSLGSPFF